MKGKRKNLTLYLSDSDIALVREQAKIIMLGVSAYVMELVQIDSEMGLLKHMQTEGNYIELASDAPEGVRVVPENEEPLPIEPGEMPVPKDVQEVQKEFQENLAKTREKELAETGPGVEEAVEEKKPEQPRPKMQRPVTLTLQQLVAQQTGVFPSGNAAKGKARNPGASGAEQAAESTIGEDWRDKLHDEQRKGESGERKLRKEILDNLEGENEEA